MKKFNMLFVISFIMYICVAFLTSLFFLKEQKNAGMYYKVEINEIMNYIETVKDMEGIKAMDLSLYSYVKNVEFLSIKDSGNIEKVKRFYDNKNGMSKSIEPLVYDEYLCGYIRFDYVNKSAKTKELFMFEGIILLFFLFLITVLVFVKEKVIRPFNILSEMPYELSKGHFNNQVNESKNKFFGKFLWGISMLQDSLNSSKNKELKLLKDKKMLLLSLSHDIKIPLSTIKLYAKALNEGMYNTEEEKLRAVSQIEKHSIKIEKYIKEIITTSSEDIMVIEVEDGEFYLKDYLDRILEIYRPKCNVVMTQLSVNKYENRLVKGDIEKSIEVMENIFENALKYGDKQKIKIDFYEEEYCQIISVYNTGTQIKNSEMPHLFDSFYRGSNVENKSGNGLGLYISKQIMKKMDGDIFVQKAEGGMCFSLVFRLVI